MYHSRSRPRHLRYVPALPRGGVSSFWEKTGRYPGIKCQFLPPLPIPFLNSLPLSHVYLLLPPRHTHILGDPPHATIPSQTTRPAGISFLEDTITPPVQSRPAGDAKGSSCLRLVYKVAVYRGSGQAEAWIRMPWAGCERCRMYVSESERAGGRERTREREGRNRMMRRRRA